MLTQMLAQLDELINKLEKLHGIVRAGENA
jgi:hypothetical protein